MNPLRSLSTGRKESWDPLSWISKGFGMVKQGGPSRQSNHGGWGNGLEGEDRDVGR